MKHSNKKFKTLILSIALLLAGIQGFSQVGFNNPNPDSSAILDLKANDKGLLVPRMTTVDRTNMTLGGKTPAHGLLVFDNTQNMFFVYDTVGTKWVAVNPWSSIGSTADIKTSSSGNVGIGTIAAPTAKLEVNGNIKADNNLIATGNVTATNATLSGTVTSTSISTGNVNSTTTVTATTFVGNGTIPIGGIIMWSGSIATIPAGWALCNGGNGTPNLSGRFIVSAGTYVETSGTYTYVPGNAAGEAKHALTMGEMPGHQHSFSYNNSSTGANGISGSGTLMHDNFTTTTTTTWTGGDGLQHDSNGNPHENRPPYYALAYIMRIQ